MRGLPWLPWFHRDFLAATQGWTLLERGAYFMLLCASWEVGPLPADHRRLAAIIGAQVTELEGVWPLVGPKFEATESGLINRRLEEHRADQVEKCEKARGAALKRWGRDPTSMPFDANGHAGAPANAHATASKTHKSEHMRPDMHPEPKPEREPKSEPGRGVSFGNTRPQVRTSSSFHREVIAAYHELLPDLPRVKAWPAKRRQALDARIRERCKDGKAANEITYWRAFFGHVRESDFLSGRRTDFCADLSWLLKPENFLKVIEGKYNNRARGDSNGEARHAR